MIEVSRRARRHEDRAGDPLDGLVNLFDVGIVLAVGFLLAALASLHLTDAFTQTGLARPGSSAVTVRPGDTVEDVPDSSDQVVGNGTKVGTVYRLDDGRLVYVIPSPVPSTSGAPGVGP